MSPPFSALLLAGGKSTRMGRDKAFLEIDGLPLWKRQLSILQELQPQEIFIAGPPREAWKDFNVLPDARPNVGPLGGLTSALRHCATPLLLVLAVDLAEMTAEYLRRLLDDCTERVGVIPQANGRFEPLAAVYPVSALSIAEDCLAAGNYSMQHLAGQCAAQQLVRQKDILRDEHILFTNLNTPEDAL